MITIITERGTEHFPDQNWLNPDSRLHESCHGNNLILSYSNKPFPCSLLLASPLLIDSGCLNNKVLISPGAIQHAFFTHKSFEPLRSGLDKFDINDFTPDLFVLMAYFYLNPLPFSFTMIAGWLTEAGIQTETAEEMSRAVFYARTCRDDSDLWFVNAETNMLPENFPVDTDLNIYRIPDNLVEVVDIMQKSDRIIYHTDALDMHRWVNRKHILPVNLEKISECSFIIEDHAVVIAGLASTITEIARVSEHRWPLFLDKLLCSIPLYKRDFYSAGRLAIEKPGILLTLRTDYSCEIELFSLGIDGKVLKTSFETICPNIFQPENLKGVPLYIQIRKPD